MRSFSWGQNQRGLGWLNNYVTQHPMGDRVRRLWRWTLVSLGCAAGCSSPQHPGHVVGPVQATGEFLTHAGDSMTEAVTGKPHSNRMFSPTNGSHCWNEQARSNVKTPMSPNMTAGGAIPAASPAAAQLGSLPPGSYVITQVNPGTAVSGNVIVVPPSNKPAVAHSNAPTAVPAVATKPMPLPAATTPLKIPGAELTPVATPTLLPPPGPMPLKTASSSRPINPMATGSSSADEQSIEPVSNSSNSNNVVTPQASNAISGTPIWCQVRIRNISNKSLKKFAASILPPAECQLVVKDTQTSQTMNVAQCDVQSDQPVNHGEELSITVGLITNDKKSRHLHVQIHDALGGNTQAIQSRWQVVIDPVAAP